jgi:hypothetical protein
VSFRLCRQAGNSWVQDSLTGTGKAIEIFQKILKENLLDKLFLCHKTPSDQGCQIFLGAWYQNWKKLGFLVWKRTIWQPCFRKMIGSILFGAIWHQDHLSCI